MFLYFKINPINTQFIHNKFKVGSKEPEANNSSTVGVGGNNYY